MKVIDAAHEYELAGNQTVKFIKRTNGELIHAGTTNEEMLEVVIDRTNGLDAKFPCDENKQALVYLNLALDAFNSRTAKRVAQGVETKDIAHVS